MADITESDVKLYQSEDQTDTDQGGGRISSNVVVSGEINNLFPNISRVDRLQGRIQPKKVFQKIDSANTGTYSGAHLIVRDMPRDENVSVLMFPTDDHNDRLPDIVDYMESYYEASTPAGNAGLEYAVDPGDRQLVFKIRHYEYTPVYDRNGKLVYSKKIDAKYALNITVGDLLMLDDGEGTQEHIHIQEMERITEHLDNADAKHYYTVEYIVVTLAAALLNAFPADTVPNRVKKNPSWKCYGAMMLGADASEGDTLIDLESSQTRIAPVVSRDIAVSDQAFFGPPSIADNVAVGADGIEWTMDQAEAINTSESILAIAGKTSYTHVLENKPLEASSLQIWYRSNLGWYVITETDGALSGDGSGTVSGDGVLTMTLDQAADEDTRIMLFYTRTHNLDEIENVDLVSAGVDYSEKQVSLPAETETLSGTIEAAPIEAGLVRLSVDDGSGWEEIGTDGGGGVLTGDNINACEIDYITGAWSLTLQSPYTSGVVLKWEFVPLTLESVNEAHGLGTDFAGKKSGSVTFYLSKLPVEPGSVDIRLVIYYTYDNFVSAEIQLTDDGGGNLDSAGGDGSASGNVDYESGKVTISFTFDHTIDQETGLSWRGTYNRYVSNNYEQSSLPYQFSLGREDTLPGSFLIKYFTEGEEQPWYAREMGSKTLEIVASLSGWQVSPDILNLAARDIASLLLLNDQWVVASGDAAGSYSFCGLDLSVDGINWSNLSHDIPEDTHLYHLAAKPGVYVGVGATRDGTLNAGVSNDLISWSVSTIGTGADMRVGVVYVAGLDMFVAVGLAEIWTSVDDGGSWIQPTSAIANNMAAITVTDFGAGEVINIFGQDNQAQWSLDGASWSGVQSKLGVVVDTAVITIAGQVTLFVVDASGGVAKSINGKDFERLAESVGGVPVSMAADGLSCLLVALDDGTMRVSRNYGGFWSDVSLSYQWAAVEQQKVAYGPETGFVHLTKDASGSYEAKVAVLPRPVMTDEAGDPVLEVGTFDPGSGAGEISAGDLPIAAVARYFLTPRRLASFVVFTWGAGPLKENSFTVFGQTHTGVTLMLSEDPANPGTLAGDGTGTLDKETGVAEMTFAYSVRPETIRISYNYGSIYKPEYDEINTRALPMDGLVTVVKAGDVVVLVEHARARLSAEISDTDMAIDVDDGSIFPDREITVKIDDEQIIGTMAGDVFSVTERGANSTAAAAHDINAVLELVSRQEEMLPVLQVSGNRITTPNPLAHDYKAGGAILTSAIVKGDLRARFTGSHTQQEEISGEPWIDPDEYSGNPADGAYNFTNYPLELTNQGATTERWKITVTAVSPVLVKVEGEYLGIISTDVPVSGAIEPANPQTGGNYFSLAADGWGSGWQVGNILRFDTVMAGGPAWVVRVINARASDIQDDYATVQSRGDVAV